MKSMFRIKKKSAERQDELVFWTSWGYLLYISSNPCRYSVEQLSFKIKVGLLSLYERLIINSLIRTKGGGVTTCNFIWNRKDLFSL